MRNICLLHLVFLSSFCVISSATIEQKVKESLLLMSECLEKVPLAKETLEKIRSKQVPDDPYSPCFFACLYKRMGIINAHGYFAVDDARAVAQVEFQNDEANMHAENNLIEHCKHVNDAHVSDGEKGCERAKLLYACSLEKARTGM